MCNESGHSHHNHGHHSHNGAIEINPVGIISSQYINTDWVSDKDPEEWLKRANHRREQCGKISEITVNEELEGILDGIDGFSHLMVFFWGHKVSDDRHYLKKIVPFGNPSFPMVGIFATHSPVRPNPILVTIVKLLERNGNVLKVTGLDALDGSPLLDIKPYNPYKVNTEDIKQPEWLKEFQRQFDSK